MGLEDKLAAIREGAKKRMPPEALAMMGNATAKLRASGIMDGAVKVGDPMPAFTLKNHNGADVSSSALLQKGPLVVTFFRGKW